VAVQIPTISQFVFIKGPQLFHGYNAASVWYNQMMFLLHHIFLFLALIIHIVTVLIFSGDVFHIANTHCPTCIFVFDDIILAGTISLALFQS
jgi:hypothetical protein